MSPGPQPFATPSAGPAMQVALTRTSRGWCVQSAAGSEGAGDLLEGLTLADLVAEELGVLTEPDRTARRSARGRGGGDAPLDPAAARVAELQRTVAQLEHALAARVSTERAIGVLAERHGTSARTAFDALRRDARSQGRPVAELAREVLDSMDADPTPASADTPSDERSPRPPGQSVPAVGLCLPAVAVASGAPPMPRPAAGPAVVTPDGVS